MLQVCSCEESMARLKKVVYKNRVRVKDFLADFDRLRTGTMHKNHFITGAVLLLLLIFANFNIQYFGRLAFFGLLVFQRKLLRLAPPHRHRAGNERMPCLWQNLDTIVCAQARSLQACTSCCCCRISAC